MDHASSTKRRKKLSPWFGVLGLVYGLALSSFALLSIGVGHGTELPLILFSAPLGLWRPAILLTPFLWGFVGSLLSKLNGRSGVIIFSVVMIAHYGGAIILLSEESRYDWEKLWEFLHSTDSFGVVIACGILFYVVGQIFLWRTFTRNID